MPTADARQHPRARARIKVEYHFGNTTGVGHSGDISEGGMLLTCPHAAPPGTRIYLRMHLPGSQKGEPLKIIGRVMRTVEGESPAVGLHFEVAYARTREALALFIDALLDVETRSGAAAPRIHELEGSTGADPAFVVRLPGADGDPKQEPHTAELVRQAFAFKPAAPQDEGVAWGRVGMWAALVAAAGALAWLAAHLFAAR